MSKLEFLARPLVEFDPANKLHRQWFSEYQLRSTWGGCPVRFMCSDTTGGDLPRVITNQLISYYVEQEFNST